MYRQRLFFSAEFPQVAKHRAWPTIAIVESILSISVPRTVNHNRSIITAFLAKSTAKDLSRPGQQWLPLSRCPPSMTLEAVVMVHLRLHQAVVIHQILDMHRPML